MERKTNEDEIRYPIIHLKGEDIEIAITHNNDYGEDIYSFVNGQHTTQGGTHQQAFREAYVKTIRDFYKKEYDAADIRTGIVAAVSVRVVEPVFESQTKTKLAPNHTIVLYVAVCAGSYRSSLDKKSPTNCRILGPPSSTFAEPSFVLVWLSKTGSTTLTETAATIPVLISAASYSFL